MSNIGDYCKSEEEFKNFVRQLKERVLNENGIIIIVSITNHIMMDYDSCERTKMNWDEMEQFNKNNEGRAYLPISNLGIQNGYTTYLHNEIKDLIKTGENTLKITHIKEVKQKLDTK